MFSYSQKKSSHCQQDAMNTLQSIFPQLNLPQFKRSSSVWEILQKSAKNLPRPGLSDITSTISNMKTVVDSQQLKIQKNMIEIQKCQEIIMSEKKPYFTSSSKYIDYPTGVKKFHKNFQQQQYVEESIEQQLQMDNYEQFEVNKKNQFFSEPDEIYYFQQSHNSQIRHDVFDDQEDVKKYLSFDF